MFLLSNHHFFTQYSDFMLWKTSLYFTKWIILPHLFAIRQRPGYLTAAGDSMSTRDSLHSQVNIDHANPSFSLRSFNHLNLPIFKQLGACYIFSSLLFLFCSESFWVCSLCQRCISESSYFHVSKMSPTCLHPVVSTIRHMKIWSRPGFVGYVQCLRLLFTQTLSKALMVIFAFAFIVSQVQRLILLLIRDI